jgi:hypothetical protein
MLYRPDPKPGQKDRKFYLQVLKSDACQCERPKQVRRALCFKCFYRLPGEIRRALYSRIGQGFEKAYEEAVRFLNEQ